MKTTFRILSTLSFPILIAACPGKPAKTETGAASAKTEVVPTEVKPAAEKIAHADEAGCIYAEGEKDEGATPECPHGPENAADGAAAGGAGHYGSAFTLADGDAKPLASVLKADVGEKPVLVAGEVEAVCQKKGCWMVIKDGAEQARVLMKDHGFAVPKDCRGKKAVIEGTLTSRTFNEAQVKHLAKDGGQDPEAVSGERTEHVLTASGVRIQS